MTFSNIGGATASGYSPPSLTANRYYRRNVTSGSCGTVSSASILITVYANLTAGTVGSPQTICYNTVPAALTQLTAPTGGPGAYTYQWQSSPDNVTFSNIGGATGAGYAPPALTTATYYRRNVTSGSCGTVSSPSIMIGINPLPAPSISGETSPCLNTTKTYTTALVGGHTYLWIVANGTISGPATNNSVNIQWNIAAGPGSMRVTETITATGCSLQTPLYNVTVTPAAPAAAGAITGPANVCYGQSGVNYSITAVANASNYVWTVPAGVTIVSGQGTTAVVVDFAPGAASPRTISVYPENGCGAGGTSSLNVNIYNQLTAGTIGTAQSICYNTIPAALTQLTAPTGGPGGYTYQWQSSPDNSTWTNIGGATAVGYAPPALTATTYYRRQVTSGTCGTVNSASILITVYGNLTPGTIGNAQTICYNTIPAPLTELTTPTGGPGGYTYQWQDSPDNITFTNIGGATATGYTPPALMASRYYRRQVTSGTCGTVNSTSILITVYGNLTAGTIGTAQSICYNTAPAALTQLTAPTGGTGVYTYQWQDSPDNVTFNNIAGATTVGYTPPVLTTTTYYRRNVTSGTCGTVASASVTITVYGNLTAGTIGTAQSICYNTAPAALTQLTAPTGGTGAYTWQWQSSPDNSTWTNIGGATAAGYAPAALTASTYFRRQVTSGSCGTVNSASILITVYGNLTAGTIGSVQTICYNTAPAPLTELTAPTGGPGGYTYQWQSSPDNATWTGIGGATAAGYAPAALTASTYYRRQVTSGSCGTVNSGSILITVYGNLTAGTIGTAQSICYNTIPSALTQLSAPTGGTGAYTYQWQSSPDNSSWTSIGGATGAGYAPPALSSGTYYRRQVTSGSCGTVNSASILITVYGNLTSGTIGSNQSVCYNTAPAALTELTAPTGGPGGYTYQWQNSADNATWNNIGGATAAGYTPPALTASTYYRRQVTGGTCGTVSSASILVTVYGNLTPGTIGSNQSICYNTAPAAFTNNASPTGGTGLTYQWQNSPAGMGTWVNIPGATALTFTESALLTASTDYRRVTTSASGCGTVNSNVITVTVKQLPAITAGQNPSTCSGIALNYQILLNNFVNPGDNVTFTWPAPVHSAGVAGGTARAVGTSANLTDTYTNTSGGIGTVTYAVTPVKDGCTGPTVNVVVSVGSEPVLDPGLNRTVCSNAATGLILKEAAGSVIPTHYNIISEIIAPGLVADASNAIVPNAISSANYLSADKFTNLTGVDKTVTYRVQPVLAPNCFGAPVDVIITVRPQPVVVPGQIKTVCSGAAIGKQIFLLPANTPAGTLFNWNAPLMSDASVQGTAGVNVAADPAGTIHINDIIHNYSSAPITATYTITPVSQFGCAGNPVPVVITINQEPVPQPISGRINLCVGDKNIVYNVNPVGGSSFHWTVDPLAGTITFDFNTNAILIDAALAAGSGNISVYETNSLGCSGDPSNLAVQVYTQPAPENIVGNAVVCALSTHNYSVTNRVGSVYNWTVPGGAAIIGDPSANSISIVFGNVGGTILVRETNIAGCVTNHSPFSVAVNPLPTAIISNGGTMCDGGTRPLNVAFTGTAPFNFTYAINGVPQTPISTGSNPYIINATLAGTYTIVNVTDNTGCTNTGSGSTTITYFPKPTGIISGGGELCRGSSTTLTLTFTGVAPFTFTYTDGITPVTVTGHPTNVYTASVSPLVNSTYTLTSLTDFNSCAGVLSGSAVINVNQPPVLSLTGTNLICYNVPTGAVDMTISGGTAPFGIAWTGPNGFTSPTEDISGLNEGYYAVTVTDSKGCKATANITLTQPPVLNATLASTNVTCFGANDGTITISGATGGTGTYEYTINGGTSWAGSGTFTGLAPGTYNVRIRDAVNPTCILVLNPTLVITQPDALSASLLKTDITCFGANNGSIIISGATGGYGTYQYTINGGTTWLGSANFTNLIPGTYNVRIRDAVNTSCAITLNPALIVTEPPVLTATVNRTNISCFGSTDGTITISAAAGGHGTYEYSINGGGSWQATGNYTGLTPGTYNVQIRDAAYTGCYIVLNNALVITQPAVLTATLSSTNVTCNSANDGTISITGASGGFGTYEYTINGGTAWGGSGLFTNVAPGTYDVRIRDAANPACVIILNAGLQITEPAALTAMVVDTDISCFGAANGIITITNSAGGYGTFQYSINGGGTWQDSPVFSPLSAGSYDVRIRDKAHITCVVILPSVTISEPSALSALLQSTNVTCNGANDGTITISGATGGYGSYSYSINGGASWQGSGTFTGLAPGTYNVRMRDALNPACIVTLNPAPVISQPAVLNATVTSSNVTCFGATDGSITITNPTGGYGTYEYSIDGGASWQATGNFTGLAPGFYNVQIRDAAHITCIVTLNGSLRITEPSALSANVASNNVTCNGANNGRITISGATGGYGTYEYSVSGGASWQATGTFTNLVPGSYNVRIRDAAHTGCIIVLNPALVITEPVALSATLQSTNVTCFGANNGIITITGAAGGYGTYEYTINGGTNWSGLNNFSNLSPGTYNVRIRDAVNTACTVTLNPALVITQPAVLNAVVARTNVTCFGGGDGTITITNPTGGYGTYEYSINGGGSWQASGSFTGLGPGNYNVRIRDAASITCIIVLNNALQITQPAILSAAVTPTMVTCNGANDGIIRITAPSGGYGTYEYSINGGTNWQASGTFNGLAPGTFDVRIRDAANIGCVVTLNPALVITEPAILNAVVSSVNAACFGANNGMILITNPTGGYGTYEYSHDGGASWQLSGTFSSLAPGSYDVRIRDRAHITCVTVLPAAVITEPIALSALLQSTNVNCNGANDGTITITNPLGGYGTYAYTINGGASWQTSGTFNYVSPGTYNVRIRDAANTSCEIVLNPALVITQPSKLAATVANTAITCYGANNGTITITAPTGGYGTYDYSVNGGTSWQAAGSFTALAPGFYNVQIRDAANITCVVILNGSLRITEPPVLTANVNRTNITCNGANDGTITITSPMGGYGTYQYSITGGTSWQATGSFTGLAPGNYNVQIRDAAQTACVVVLNPALAITQPAILTATVTSVNVSCFGANDGSISVSGAAGGYGAYQYSVNGGTTWQGFGSFTNLAPGTYNVRIRDAANPACIVTLNPALAITQPAVLAASIASTNVTCFGGNDGTITISGATGGYGTYEYSINGGGSWQASGSFTGLTPGSYNILIRDAARTGCIIVLNSAYIITQPGMLSATISKTDVSCRGNNDGTINITSPAGGYGTYEYSINGGTSWQTSGNYTNLAPGSYNIRIRDAAHTACSVILYPNLLITEPITLSMSSTGNVILDCFGDMDGMGTFFASGGTMPYTFLVISNTTGGTIAAPGFNSQTFFNAGAGSITVRVVDFNGCSAQATINITQPAVLNPGTIAAGQVVCYGDNPAMLTETSAPNGGTAVYIYQWQSSTNIAGPFINIAGATLNQYTPPAGATYTLYYRRMVTSGTCMPVYSNVVQILVNPRPVAFLTGGETICPGLSSVIRVNMLAGTGPFTAEIANHGIVNNYISGADIVVTPAVTTTYSLIRVRDSNNCEVVAPSPNLNGTATVIVSNLPVITSFTPSPAVCEFTLASFRVTATGTNLTYQWFVNQGSGFNAVVDGGTYFGAMTSTLQIFNTVRTMNGYVYHVVISGCGSSVTSPDATFTVNTAPEITLHPKDSTVCLSNNAIMEANATGTNVTWKWYVNKGLGFVLSVDDANFSGSATRTLTITNAQVSFNNWVFRAVATGICGAPVNTNFAILRVINPPVATLQPVAKTVCENGSTSFLGNGTGYNSLQWQVFSGGVWTNLTDNATYIGTNTQQLAIMNAPVGLNGNQYRLALISACTTTYTNAATITVNANPVVDFSAIDPISACGGVPIVINGNPTGGSGIYSQHRWTGDVGPLNSYTVQSPTFNSLITGTYNLNYRVTDSKGCTANDDVAVTVDSPSAQFTQDADYGCTPLTVTFTKDMTGFSKWWWNFGDGSPLDSLNANPVHNFVNSVPGSIGYYNVKLRVRSTGGCYAEFTSTITVYPAIDATFTPNVTVICSGNPITFTALPGATRYFWEYGDGASGYATNISTHLFTNLTTAPVVRTVKLTTTSFYNCVDIKTFDITVMPVPIPQFTAVPLTQVFNAAGNPVTFTNTTNPGTWNWFWKFGDNTTSTVMNPVHSYTNVGTFSVTLIASNANCSDSVKHNVSVVPPAPVANFDSIPSGCSPLYVNINNTSLNTSIPGTTYQWDFGDGSHSTAKNPTYTYFSPGTYRIELVVTGPGGTSMKTQVVNAYASPKAYFEITPPIVYVNDERVRCFNLSQGATSYLWDFGDGDTSKVKEPYHRYMEEGVFDITLWAYSSNGCTDQYILSPAVTVEPVGELRFSTVFIPNKTGPIERTDLPTGGYEADQFFYPPIRQKVLNYKLQIFNRLGVLIFQSNDINVPWNGYYKGKLCQQGVYVWYVEGKYADGKPFKQVGNVTLLQ